MKLERHVLNPLPINQRGYRIPFGDGRNAHPWLNDLRAMVQMLNREIEIPHPTFQISKDQLYRILAGANLPDEWYENQERRNVHEEERFRCLECTKALHRRMRAERDIPKDELLVLSDSVEL